MFEKIDYRKMVVQQGSKGLTFKIFIDDMKKFSLAYGRVKIKHLSSFDVEPVVEKNGGWLFYYSANEEKIGEVVKKFEELIS